LRGFNGWCCSWKLVICWSGPRDLLQAPCDPLKLISSGDTTSSMPNQEWEYIQTSHKLWTPEMTCKQKWSRSLPLVQYKWESNHAYGYCSSYFAPWLMVACWELYCADGL
jgi:hypothetical protein